MTEKEEAIQVLVIDDEPIILSILSEILPHYGYHVITARNGEEGIEQFKKSSPDLVLTDLQMPEMNGYQVIDFFHKNHSHVPVIVISGQVNIKDALQAIRMGAWDYITKPIGDIDILIYTINKALDKALLIQENEEYKQHLEEKIQLRTEELNILNKELQDVVFSSVRSFAILTEKRDPYTAGHQERVAQLAVLLAKELGYDKKVQDGIWVAGLLHDIGKIYVPSEFLTKPSRLEVIEFEIIKKHASVGHEILCSIPFPWPVADMVHQHHERINGTGYPSGLQGDAILPESMLLAVADSVEAMASHRPYRPSMGLHYALNELQKGKGIIFCAQCVDVFEHLVESGNEELKEIIFFESEKRGIQPK